MCIILREAVSLLGRDFPTGRAKSHQINGALEWLTGCNDSYARAAKDRRQ